MVKEEWSNAGQSSTVKDQAAELAIVDWLAEGGLQPLVALLLATEDEEVRCGALGLLALLSDFPPAQSFLLRAEGKDLIFSLVSIVQTKYSAQCKVNALWALGGLLDSSPHARRTAHSLGLTGGLLRLIWTGGLVRASGKEATDLLYVGAAPASTGAHLDGHKLQPTSHHGHSLPTSHFDAPADASAAAAAEEEDRRRLQQLLVEVTSHTHTHTHTHTCATRAYKHMKRGQLSTSPLYLRMCVSVVCLNCWIFICLCVCLCVCVCVCVCLLPRSALFRDEPVAGNFVHVFDPVFSRFLLECLCVTSLALQ